MIRTGWRALAALALMHAGQSSAQPDATPATSSTRPPTREGFVGVEPGVRLYYRIEGTGRDTVIVPFASVLADALAPLARRHTLIFYDMRSRGRSSAVQDTTRLGVRVDVQDLEAVRRHFRIGHPAIVGFSYLGAVAALYAATYEERPSRLALLGPLAPRVALVAAAQPAGRARLDSSRVATLTAALRDSATSDGEPLCRQFWDTYLPVYVGGSTGAESVRRALESTCAIPNEWPRAFNATLRHVSGSMGAWDWTEEARRVRAPTLVIQGDMDVVAPASGGVEWARLIRGARLMSVSGVGHLAWAEAPSVVLPALERFLDGGWPADARRVE
jgi:pimeloyl-ACP methyl ester carboxylesterase